MELYLAALVRHHGVPMTQLRKLGHDLGKRASLAAPHGLKLRKRTAEHLVRLSAENEYRACRYGPLTASYAPNRMNATLNEVAGKVAGLMSAAVDLKRAA